MGIERIVFLTIHGGAAASPADGSHSTPLPDNVKCGS
jgi:hypothetical protein